MGYLNDCMNPWTWYTDITRGYHISRYIRQWTWLLRNFLMMEQKFSVTNFWTWDSRRGGKLRFLRLWLSMLGVNPVAKETNWIDVMLFSCLCCLISCATSCHMLCFSVIMHCRLWVNGIYMSMNALSLFVLSANLMSGRLLLLLFVLEHSSLKERDVECKY